MASGLLKQQKKQKIMEMWLLHGVRILWPVCLSVVVNFLYAYSQPQFLRDCLRSCVLTPILVSCLIGSRSVSNMYVIQEMNTIVKMRHFIILLRKKVIMFSAVYIIIFEIHFTLVWGCYFLPRSIPTGEFNTSEIRV